MRIASIHFARVHELVVQARHICDPVVIPHPSVQQDPGPFSVNDPNFMDRHLANRDDLINACYCHKRAISITQKPQSYLNDFTNHPGKVMAIVVYKGDSDGKVRPRATITRFGPYHGSDAIANLPLAKYYPPEKLRLVIRRLSGDCRHPVIMESGRLASPRDSKRVLLTLIHWQYQQAKDLGADHLLTCTSFEHAKRWHSLGGFVPIEETSIGCNPAVGGNSTIVSMVSMKKFEKSDLCRVLASASVKG